MNRVYDKSITIQKMDEAAKAWVDLYKVHARINKASGDNEFLNSGAVRLRRNLVFEIRYFKDLETISLNLQTHRILYSGVPYNLVDYDDYLLQHKTVKLSGESY